MFQFPEGQPSSIAEVGALRSGTRSRRNGAIDFLRFVFACAIVLYHFRRDVFPGGYIAVEFFFIVTGYLAAREAEYVGTVRHRESEWLDSSVGEIRQLRRQDWTLTVF